MLVVEAASTYASSGSVGFEDFFGFFLAGIAIVAGIAFFFLTRKNAV